MNLRSRSGNIPTRSSGQPRTILGDVGNRSEPIVKGANAKVNIFKKKKNSNASSVSLGGDKDNETSNTVTIAKTGLSSRRFSSRLNIKRQREEKREMEEKEMKKQRIIEKEREVNKENQEIKQQRTDLKEKRTHKDNQEIKKHKIVSKERQSHKENKEIKEIKKQRIIPKESSQAQDENQCLDRRSHIRHKRQINYVSIDEKSKEETAEGQTFLVNPEYRLNRRSFDWKSLIPGIASHDESNLHDELQVVPYVTDLFQHLYRDEEKYRPQMYMTLQKDINAKMRAILIDWLVEVHMKFRLAPETLYLCVNIIDRYCNRGHVMRSQLQLVGVTALLVACKYEEIYPPEVNDCVYITDKAYTRKNILDMEQKIVHKLRFHITVPTAFPFLQRFLTVVKASTLIKHAATYYTERTLQEYELNKFKPSVISAAAVVLALNNPDICAQNELKITLVSGMPSVLLEYTEFDVEEIRECARRIAEKVAEEPITASQRKLGAVKKKYDNRRYMRVSAMRLPCKDTCIFLR